jgi:hypothetical protein
MFAAVATTERHHGLRIGDVLRRGRARLHLDLRGAEARTKIRAKYLRALEEEDWDALPGPTYTKGYLRVYAQLLEVDGQALVDEYWRRVERSLPNAGRYSLSEPVLEHRRRPAELERLRRRRARLVAGGVVAALAASVVAVLIATGGGGGGGSVRELSRHHAGARGHRAGTHGNAGKPVTGSSGGGAVSLALSPRDDVELCLVRADGTPQIDSQTLTAGSHAGPFNPSSDRYRLDLDSGGAVELTVNGKALRVGSKRPSSYLITSGGVRPIDFKGPGCP